MRYVKGKVFKKTTRLVCRFPFAVKLLYRAYQNIIVYSPFLRTSYKWKMIKTELVHFEIERSLYKKGKSRDDNVLLQVNYYEGDQVSSYKDIKKSAGSYTLDMVSSGLGIEGKAASKKTDRVYLKINDTVVKEINVNGKARFSFMLKKPFLQKLPSSSVLSIENADSEKLAYKKADRAVLTVPFGLGTIDGIIKNGFSLSKKGTIVDSAENLEQKKEKYLELYSLVKEAFDKEINTPLFLMYGTLLGHTREGDFIANDDDFDAGYVSLKNGPKEVKEEAIEIILTLLRKGFNVSINPVGRLFKIHKNTGVHLDIMPVWFEGEWNVAYRGACVRSSVEDYLPAKKGVMRGREVYVPQKPEKFLAGYYGENWRIPDPGYTSDYTQTGKTLLKNYLNYLITPREFLQVNKMIEEERTRNPEIGTLTASAFKGGFSV